MNFLKDKNSWFVIHGISMRQLFENGQWVLINRETCPSVGDVIVFSYSREGYLIHRVIKIHGCYYHVKGDNSFRTEIIPQKNIIGVVIQYKCELGTYNYNPSRLYKLCIAFFSRKVAKRFNGTNHIECKKTLSFFFLQKLDMLYKNLI